MEKDRPILNSKTRIWLHFYLSTAYISGGMICFLPYFFPEMVGGQENLRSTLWAGGLLFFLGMSIVLLQAVKHEKIKDILILAVMLFSIPVVTLGFIEYAGITVWAFPAVLMFASLVFNTRVPLILITAMSVVTQLLVWINVPVKSVQVDEFDYVMRIGIYIIALWLGLFINRVYIERLKENSRQIEFQKLISDISFDFISVSQLNFDGNINAVLKKTGLFLKVDRTYIFLLNSQDSTMNYACEWCREGGAPERERVQQFPLETFPWGMEQLRGNKLIYIKDVDKLPDEAAPEKEQLIRRGVKSAVIIPIVENGEILGVMGFDSFLSHKSWPDEYIQMLKILSNLLANGLLKIKSEEKIEHLAYYDYLTGLPNRLLFSDRLVRSLRLAGRDERLTGIIFLDLDSFKMVNDTMGHSAGDTVLQEVASGLTRRLEKTDTVARFGGDEFLIMVNNLEDYESIVGVADRVMEMFEIPFSVNGQTFFITGSAGIAVYPFDGEDAETLIKNADIAMYMAKNSGKNQYALCTADMNEKVKKDVRLSNSLYQAEERNELVVCYQPQIRLQTGGIVGLEALLRWNHPELGMILPRVFIPLAEANGTISSIGQWVLKTAIRQNKKWQDMGFPHLRMAINISPVQFNNPDFAENLNQLLKEEGLSPKYLELEITESVATKESGHILNTLNKLKQLGVTISIDDFGREYSSLNRLKTLPVDRIKIDMQFVHGIEGSEKDQAITKVIINLAKNLGLEVLAEGVETMPQLDFLNKKMCDEVQGYYYFKPMTAEEIEEILAGSVRKL